MLAAMETHVFRVTVRGRFAGLSDEDRRRLIEEHDPTRLPRFTEAGDFTQDGRPDFFSYRIQVRQRAETAAEAADAAEAAARSLALADLATRGLGHRDLRLSVRAMADAWR
jgi:uncharacterized protein YggE